LVGKPRRRRKNLRNPRENSVAGTKGTILGEKLESRTSRGKKISVKRVLKSEGDRCPDVQESTRGLKGKKKRGKECRESHE